MSCPPPTFFGQLNETTGKNIEIFLAIYDRIDSEMCNDTFANDQKFKLALEMFKGAKLEYVGGVWK